MNVDLERGGVRDLDAWRGLPSPYSDTARNVSTPEIQNSLLIYVPVPL